MYLTLRHIKKVSTIELLKMIVIMWENETIPGND